MIVSRGGKFGADFVCDGLFSLTLFFLRNYTDRTGDRRRRAIGLVERQVFFVRKQLPESHPASSLTTGYFL